jgi:hypothetical protein
MRQAAGVTNIYISGCSVLLSDTKGRMPPNGCAHPVQMFPSKPRDQYLHLAGCSHVAASTRAWANGVAVEKKYLKPCGPPQNASVRTASPCALPAVSLQYNAPAADANGTMPFWWAANPRATPTPRRTNVPLSTQSSAASVYINKNARGSGSS